MAEAKMQYTNKDLHIAHGAVSGASLRHCLQLPTEHLLIEWDNLSCGPLTSVEDEENWKKLRRKFWYAEGHRNTKGLPDPSLLYIRLSAERDRVRASENVFLWLSTTLAEQMLLAWLVSVFTHLKIKTGSLRLLDLRPLPGKVVRSISVLNCEQLKDLSRWREPGEKELESYEAAWQAVSSSSPNGLIAFCAQDTPHPAPLTQALRAFMARYPDVATGLNHWDRIILANSQVKSLKAARIIGHTITYDLQYPDWPGDVYLFDRLKHLGDSRLAHPLLTLTGNLSAMRFVEAAITETGRQVLAGQANHVDLNGIDDWVGGVHLKARSGSPWVFDGETLVPGRAA